MSARQDSTRKLSRQQLRALARERRDANGWIAALDTSDPWLASSIRAALGNRHVTRAELEEAIGMSLADAAPPAPAAALPRSEPERITLQHILISFAGAGTSATRTREEAASLADETLARATSGEPFADLVQAVTDDAYPGIYRLCNTGVTPAAAGEYPRDRMVPAFGNVGFGLDVNGIGMAEYDPGTSPYGWHIIKRLE